MVLPALVVLLFVLLSLALSSCSSTPKPPVVIYHPTVEYHPVSLPEDAFQCPNPDLLETPDPDTLGDRQLAAYLLGMYDIAVSCYQSNGAMRKFVNSRSISDAKASNGVAKPP
jgi:hypothetical protein